MTARLRVLSAVGLCAVLMLVVSIVVPSNPDGSTDSLESIPDPAVLMGAGPRNSLTSTIKGLQSRLRTRPDDWHSYASLGLAYLQRVRVAPDPIYYTKAEGALRRS